MTTNVMQGDRERYAAAGMDDYVSKPIRVEELVAPLERSPGRLRAGAGGAAAVHVGAGDAPPGSRPLADGSSDASRVGAQRPADFEGPPRGPVIDRTAFERLTYQVVARALGQLRRGLPA